MRPFNTANLPKPNSLGSTRVSRNGGTTRAFNVANLPKPNSLGGTHPSSGGGKARPFSLANLPKANSLGGAHQGANGTNQSSSATLHGNFHALAATHDPKGSGVIGAAKTEGAAQQKSAEANANLKTEEKKSAADTKSAASKAVALTDANAAFNAATTKLEVDKAGHQPPALIAQDQANQAKAGATLTAAAKASLQANQKVDSDKKAVATDKKTVAADKKDLQQAKQTLSEEQKIAQQKNEINKLKTQQQQNAGDSTNQAPDNGQGSSGGGGGVQSADDNQGSSGGGGGGQAANSDSSGGTGSRGSGDGAITGRGAAVVAGVAPVLGAGVVGAGVVPVGPGPAAVPPTAPPSLPPGPPPGEANPDQAAAINPTFVMVGFQKDVSNDDVSAFLQAYSASIVEGPNNDGLYKLQLNSSVPPDQMQQLLDSMKSQTNIVLSAIAE